MKAIQTDMVVIGLEPTGLYQITKLSLPGPKAVVVDSLRQENNQCCQLPPDKPIYNIPAIANALDIATTAANLSSAIELPRVFNIFLHLSLAEVRKF